jgi:hypothetical protein
MRVSVPRWVTVWPTSSTQWAAVLPKTETSVAPSGRTSVRWKSQARVHPDVPVVMPAPGWMAGAACAGADSSMAAASATTVMRACSGRGGVVTMGRTSGSADDHHQFAATP